LLVRCLSCKYDLSHLSSGGEHRCPECGRAFDPGDPSTFAAKPDRSRYAECVKFGAALAMCAAIGAIVIQQTTSSLRGKDLPALLILFLAWCIVVAIASFVLLKLGPKK
jgi:hypothetical protein